MRKVYRVSGRFLLPVIKDIAVYAARYGIAVAIKKYHMKNQRFLHKISFREV